MMSGGLDSPSVAAVAAAQLAEGGERLQTYTAVPHPGTANLWASRFNDETPFVEAIAAMYPNMEPCFLTPPLGTLFEDASDFAALTGAPQLHSFNHQWIARIARAARDRGVGVLLTGQAGNLTLSWHGRLRHPPLLRSLAEAALSRVKSAVGIEDPRWSRETALRAAVIREFRVTHRARLLGLRSGGASADGHLERIHARRRNRTNGGASFWGPQFGLEARDPTADKRIFEFCLTLPIDQFARGAEHRLLIRRMMHGRLPAGVLDNPRRGLQAGDWPEQLRAVSARLPSDLDVIERTPWLSSLLDVERLRAWVSSGLPASPGAFELEKAAKYHTALPRAIAVAAMATSRNTSRTDAAMIAPAR
jgi:asparagine synthase (glutamine-hydrolysing)